MLASKFVFQNQFTTIDRNRTKTDRKRPGLLAPNAIYSLTVKHNSNRLAQDMELCRICWTARRDKCSLVRSMTSPHPKDTAINRPLNLKWYYRPMAVTVC